MSEKSISLTEQEQLTIISLCKEKINELQIPARRNQPEEEREVLLTRIGRLSTIVEKMTA